MAKAQGSFYERLGALVREARRRKGMTQDQLGRAIGLTRTSVTNIECGRQPLQVHTLVEIAGCLGIRFDALIPRRTSRASSEVQAKLRSSPVAVQDWVQRVITEPTDEANEAATP